MSTKLPSKPILSAMLRDRCRRRRFAGDTGVALVVDAGYFIQRECVRGFVQNGWRTVPISLDPPELFIQRLLEAILVHQPDLLFTVNHLGFDRGGALTRLLEEVELPFASWFVDSPAFILLDHRLNRSALGVIPVWERSFLPYVKEFGFENTFHLPLAGDPGLFRRQCAASRRGAVAFVGDSLSAPAARWRSSSRAFKSRDALLNAASSKLQFSRGADPTELLVHAAQELNAAIPPLSLKEKLTLSSAVVLEATRRQRWAMVERLNGEDLTVLGDDGWKPAVKRGVRVKPRVDYYTELPEVYRSYDIHLNLTSLQMPTAVNQRVFDVPLSGGFLLTDAQEDLTLLFDADVEIASFAGLDELSELVAFYKERTAARERISLNAARRIAAEHTYRHRIAALLEEMRREFAPQRGSRRAAATAHQEN